jgi:hypothetical protein
MNKIIVFLSFITLISSCSKVDDSNLVTDGVWNGVFFDGLLNVDTHDPSVNYVLIIDDKNNLKVIPPTNGVEEKIISIEMINDSELNLIWQIGNETQKIKSGFSFQNENELIIEKFIYTVAQVPFPNNLLSGKFVKKSKLTK